MFIILTRVSPTHEWCIPHLHHLAGLRRLFPDRESAESCIKSTTPSLTREYVVVAIGPRERVYKYVAPTTGRWEIQYAPRESLGNGEEA